MVEVFKINKQEAEESKGIIQRLHAHFPESSITFDLGDSDKILRVEGKDVCKKKVVTLLTEYGFECEVLA